MYIITGGAGFIGSALVAKLNDLGINNILIVDELGSSEKWKNLNGKRFVEYVHKKDFFQLVSQGKLALKVTALIHLGACSSTTERDLNFLVENNYRYSQALAKWALEKGVRFIYASSAATYGDGSQGFSDSEKSIESLRPLNPYAFSKQLFDLWLLRSNNLDKVAGLKFFNVFGPNEYHKGDMLSVVYKACKQIQETGKVQLFRSYKDGYKDGEQKRDFVYVKDCCDVIWWLIENPEIKGLFNLGTGKARNWNDLATATFKALEVKENIEYIEMPEEVRDQYQYFTEADISKLRSAGYSNQFLSLEEAIPDYIRNYLLQETHL